MRRISIPAYQRLFRTVKNNMINKLWQHFFSHCFNSSN